MKAGQQLKMGDKLELAIWYDENQLRDPIEKHADQFGELLSLRCNANMIEVTEPEYQVMHPMDDRVPEVPRWLAKTPGVVPRLLVATVTVLGKRVSTNYRGFVDDLSEKDLRRLRAVTRRAHQRARPGESTLSDARCDDLINSLGVEAALECLEGVAEEESGLTVQVLKETLANNNDTVH